MDDNRRYLCFNERSPVFQLALSLVIVLGAGTFLFAFCLLAGLVIFDVKIFQLKDLISSCSEKDLAFLRYILISQQVCLFIIPSIIILRQFDPGNQKSISVFKKTSPNEIALVVLLAFCIFPVTWFTGQLNAGMTLPDWLSGVEKWMIESESRANRFLELIMVRETFRVILLNLFMIAVLPAFGEELIFRGIFQRIFGKLFKSGHAAVWATAFIFSTLHFQFFGFIPRFIMGLVFGYLFLLSGNLWLPVIAHFVNNAVPVIIAGIMGMEKLNELQGVPILEQLIVLPLPVLGIVLIFRHITNKGREADSLSQRESPPSD
jgi:membrane protease YdiL (CAAX protease family)